MWARWGWDGFAQRRQVGACCMAVTLSHLPPLRRAGSALLWAVTAFGAATIVSFGFSTWFWLSLADALAGCGAADNISVVIRHSLVRSWVRPTKSRGRVSAVNSVFISALQRTGELPESGIVAQFFGPVMSVISGGIGTIVVVASAAWIWPGIRKRQKLGDRLTSSL